MLAAWGLGDVMVSPLPVFHPCQGVCVLQGLATAARLFRIRANQGAPLFMGMFMGMFSRDGNRAL